MIQLRPGQADLQRLKEPFGRLLPGPPAKTMLALNSIISQTNPKRVVAVGDVVSRETLVAGITVNLRIIDHKSMRRPTTAFNLKISKTYRVKNPAGVITLEAWETIKQAMKDDEALIVVEGEEDLLALPCIAESPSNSLVLYGQPSQGLVVVDTNPKVREEAGLILERMTKEEVSGL
jgi:GTP-dependent dephospho-CoA kinase